MLPAKDRSATPEDNDAVFLMTNIVPQAPACNQKGWERLEDYCRRLAKDGKELQITCGPLGTGGENKDGQRLEEIGKGKHTITVPAYVWKAVIVLPHEGATPTAATRGIGVLMPNDQSVGEDWSSYRVAIKDIEKQAGCTFWPELPEHVGLAIKDEPDRVQVAGAGGGQSKREKRSKQDK